MPRNAAQTDRQDAPSSKPPQGKPGPRVISLRHLEQPFGPDTDYRIERPRREPWGALFEFHDEE